jgi:hypothetical protein
MFFKRGPLPCKAQGVFLFMEIKTKSPINKTRFTGQNLKYLKLLLTGSPQPVFSAIRHGITTPHSRVADVRAYLQSKGIHLNCMYTEINGVRCKIYWLRPEDIKTIKQANGERI